MLQKAVTIIKVILFAALLAFVIVFAANNHNDVTITLTPIPFEITMPLFLLVLLSVLLGYILALIVKLQQRLTWLRNNLKLQQQINALNTEIATLKLEHVHKPSSHTSHLHLNTKQQHSSNADKSTSLSPSVGNAGNR